MGFVFRHRAVVVVSVVAWGAANAALFRHAQDLYAARDAKEVVQLARGAGACINFNGALILVPMMRRLLTRARGARPVRALPLDYAAGFHRLVGNAMFAFALLHTGAYLVNYAADPTVTVAGELLSTVPGLSGVSLLVVFTVMWVFSRAGVRRRCRFELFSRTHVLYVGWLVLALVHAVSFWKWVGVPLVGFSVEQALRIARRANRVEVIGADTLCSHVTRLEISRPRGFRHRAGDYLLLRIPEVARRQWHPFTVSSAPERDRLTVHVRALGDWTTALGRLVEQRPAGRPGAPLLAWVDGPYRAPAADVLESRHAVLIAGGIGVTAFTSVLESLTLGASSGAGPPTPLESVDFFWLNRDGEPFGWFAELLSSLRDVDLTMAVHLFTTGGCGATAHPGTNLVSRLGPAAGEQPGVTVSRVQTRAGRPDWERELGDIAARYASERVEVYFCGPAGLGRTLRGVCVGLGMPFRQERF